jgi:hypothetical protein
MKSTTMFEEERRNVYLSRFKFRFLNRLDPLQLERKLRCRNLTNFGYIFISCPLIQSFLDKAFFRRYGFFALNSHS